MHVSYAHIEYVSHDTRCNKYNSVLVAIAREIVLKEVWHNVCKSRACRAGNN